MVSLKNQKGFTIVELLIVIVVIGILAAITLVAYNGIQNRANDTAVKSDLSSMAKQVSAYNAIHGVYPSHGQFFGTSTEMDISASKSAYSTEVYNLYYCTESGADRRNFGIAARSKSGQTYTISSTSSITETSSAPGWTVACGAFGGTVLANISFNYGYRLNDGTWLAGL